VLGGKIEMLLRNEEAPVDMPSPPRNARKMIMAARMSIDGQILMASGCGRPTTFTSRRALRFVADRQGSGGSRAPSSRRFAKAAAPTCRSARPFFSKGFGMCIDQFGIPGMVKLPVGRGMT